MKGNITEEDFLSYLDEGLNLCATEKLNLGKIAMEMTKRIKKLNLLNNKK